MPAQEPFMRTVLASSVAIALLTTAAMADARIIAVATSGDGARVVLHDHAGPCLGAAKLAEHIAPDGERIPGCWLITEGTIMVSFLDGERGNIPVAHLKKPSDI
jgi:hypothetical protein